MTKRKLKKIEKYLNPESKCTSKSSKGSIVMATAPRNIVEALPINSQGKIKFAMKTDRGYRMMVKNVS